jgi:5-methylcytosine-specific restriction endonuclease McrA
MYEYEDRLPIRPAHGYRNSGVKPGRTTATWRKLRLQCFKRDKAANAPCWICGGSIDYDAKPSSHDYAWEPDHRHSVKTHPELAEVPENVMPSHRKCNRAKRDKAAVNELGRRTRAW